jgi:prevent-host-death family protein
MPSDNPVAKGGTLGLVCLDGYGLQGRAMHWQIQEAKQRFSEVIRSAHIDGPQFVTKHGEEVAVVIDIAEYRRLRGETLDFKEFVLTEPYFDDDFVEELAQLRSAEPARTVDLAD